jgi:hypothetical protein
MVPQTSGGLRYSATWGDNALAVEGCKGKIKGPMQLDEFITQTITQICQGVANAQKEIGGKNGIQIAPSVEHYTNWAQAGHIATDKLPADVIVARDGQMVMMLSFDVSVTAEAGTNTKGGIGVLMGAISLGSSGESKKQNQAVHKLQFKIPVVLPHYA